MLTAKNEKFSAHDIAYYAIDGRLTAEPDGKHYRWSKMIGRYRELGRTLTEDEADAYCVQNLAKSQAK